MSNVAFRRAALSDLEQLAPLFDQYRQFQGKEAAPAAALDFLRERFTRSESVVFVAAEGQTLLGFAQLYPSYSSVSLARVFILNDLFVRESARRRGVASGLLAAVEDHAWSQAAVRITLNVAMDNQAGQSLYETMGWRRDAQFFMYHRFANDR